MLPAIGIGIGAGLFAFYVTRLLLQRTPLRVSHPHRSPGSHRSRVASPVPEPKLRK